MMKKYIFLRVKFLLSLWYFNRNWIFSTVFQKNPQKSNFMKIVKREQNHSTWMDRWTYILKLIVALHIFAIVHSDLNVG